ncbi:WG repeat-containing protein [Lacinutrix himadriensis]|uniref:WG repeat-containing protein n=1 Tax=Lacinutrix himadriensis TaxID=641549 RepID=UPI0006E2AA7C|nr:WG repeat-containing protein [Lacinutrix himadriensis]
MKTRFLLLAFLLVGISINAQELALAKLDSKFGYISRTGDWHIQPQFKVAKNFSDDMAAAMNDKGKWGYINRQGEWAIPPKFKKAKYFDSGIAVVLDGRKWIYINKKGEQILNNVDTDHMFDFSEGFAQIKKRGKIGFINTTGKVIVEPKFEVADDFFNGYSKIIYKDDFGVIDTTGAYLLKPEYTFVPKFIYDKNRIGVKKKGSPGVIIDGEFHPIADANRIWEFPKNSNLTPVYKDWRIGFVDHKGNWVIEPEFKAAKAFSNNLAPVYNGKRWGFINTTGDIVIPCTFDEAETFSEDGFALIFLKGRWGFINTEGKVVVEPKYDILLEQGFGFIKFKNLNKGFNNGLARVKYKKKWGFVNAKGELLNNTWFKNLELFH